MRSKAGVDKSSIFMLIYSWHLLLLYYLLTRSRGCKDKLCGLFLRARGSRGAWGWDLIALKYQGAGQERQGNSKQFQLRGSVSEGTRHSEVVQCFERVRLHPASDRGRCLRAFFRHSDGRLQIPQRGSDGGI